MSLSRTKADFFEILNFFSKATYQQKVAYMQENWGNITSEIVINYAEGCSITVGLDSLKKYYFDFNCKNLNLEEFISNLPSYAELLLESGGDMLKEKCPEFLAISVEEIKSRGDSCSQVYDEETNDEMTEQKIDDYSYLNLYNGIRINKKN